MTCRIGKMAHVTNIPIRGGTIDLDQFLKLAGVAQSGGHAKLLVQEGQVVVNGEVEMRRRRTLNVGDSVEVEGESFHVTGEG